LCVRLFGEIKVAEAVSALLRLAAGAKSIDLRKSALTALLLYDDPAIGAEVAGLYPNLPADAKPAAQTLLTSRPASTLAFLQLIAAGQVAASSVPPATAAVLREHEDKRVSELARKVFAPAASTTKPQARAEIERV